MKQNNFQRLLDKLTKIETSLLQDEKAHLLSEPYFQRFH